MNIVLQEGKYTLMQNDDGTSLRALRHGEEWRDLTGDNFVAALGNKIEELESKLEANEVTINLQGSIIRTLKEVIE